MRSSCELAWYLGYEPCMLWAFVSPRLWSIEWPISKVLSVENVKRNTVTYLTQWEERQNFVLNFLPEQKHPVVMFVQGFTNVKCNGLCTRYHHPGTFWSQHLLFLWWLELRVYFFPCVRSSPDELHGSLSPKLLSFQFVSITSIFLNRWPLSQVNNFC